MMMDDKERIEYIMLEKQLSNTEFCAVTNIAPATLSHILGKRSKPTLAILRNIVTGFPDLNPEWVLLGSGEMYRQPTSTSINMEEEHDPDDGASLFSSVTDGTDVFEGMNDIFGNVPSSSSPVRTQERPQQHKRTIAEKPEAPVQSLSDIVRETLSLVQKPQRKIVEVRIFFDDGTFETFSSH